MKNKLIIILNLATILAFSQQCPIPSGLSTSNITSINAQANWVPVSGADHYKINYRVLGASSWLHLANIGSNDSTRNIPLLQQATTYEWRIMSYCDSTNQLGSLWSQTDTFTTVSFTAAPFNPIVTTSLELLECNIQTRLYLQVSQLTNEPDIGSGYVTSDGGEFNIGSISIGDSVGYAVLNMGTNTIVARLEAGLVLGQNYAVINSFDSTGSLVGFFTIKNNSSGTGVEIQLIGSPNDNNNYTSGYQSELFFTDLFLTPPNAGQLNFFADINSELNDQVSITNTFQISCNQTLINEYEKRNNSYKVFDLLGKTTKAKKNRIQLIQFSDGSLKKQIIIY